MSSTKKSDLFKRKLYHKYSLIEPLAENLVSLNIEIEDKFTHRLWGQFILLRDPLRQSLGMVPGPRSFRMDM